jgi:hypothetical protein
MLALLLGPTLLAVAPGWCEAARVVVDDAAADVDALVAVVPADVGARARADVGRVGDRAAAKAAVAVAVRVACVDVVDDAAAAAAAAVAGPEFGGLRTDEDFSEKLQERLMRWLQELLATDAMQVFANNTRLVYLLGLLAAVSAILARLLLRSRRVRRERAAVEALVRVERARVRAFSEWQAAARAALSALSTSSAPSAAQLRACLLLWRGALLARVGEGDARAKDAVLPQRTTAEIVARLPQETASLVAPVLFAFDDAFYGGRVDVDVVGAFAAAVDAAAARVGRL